MLTASNTDVVIGHTSAITRELVVSEGEEITLEHLYQISYYDNTIYVLEVTYNELMKLMENNFYFTSPNVELINGNTYKVSILSFNYYRNVPEYMRSYDDNDTGLNIRNILIEDLREKNE